MPKSDKGSQLDLAPNIDISRVLPFSSMREHARVIRRYPFRVSVMYLVPMRNAQIGCGLLFLVLDACSSASSASGVGGSSGTAQAPQAGYAGSSRLAGNAPAQGGSTAESGGALHLGGASSATDAGRAGTADAYPLPSANAGFDYQIGGAYPPPAGVTVVSRDRNSAPADGIYNICYVNGFQTQPGEESFWRTQHAELLLRDANGSEVVDEDWGETLLDTSSDAKRNELAKIIGEWMTECAADGFEAVEIDNLDSYSRSNDLLSPDQNVTLMQAYAERAHALGLAIAQKNSTDLLSRAAEMGTDFAIAEECNRWNECKEYQAAYGNLVYVIEYRAQDFNTGCANYPELSIVLRDLDVSNPSSNRYVYQGC